jgi:hypothetical protein
MPKGLRLNPFRAGEIERLVDKADHLYACEGRPAQALQIIDRVFRLDPRNVKAWFSRVASIIGWTA